MSDRAGDLRNEAARCLAQAQTTVDPQRRAELVRMAARFHELANSVSVDFDAILQAYNDQKMVLGELETPVQQQQQQQPQQQQQIQPETRAAPGTSGAAGKRADNKD
jgi:stringent starvation protein B